MATEKKINRAGELYAANTKCGPRGAKKRNLSLADIARDKNEDGPRIRADKSIYMLDTGVGRFLAISP